MTPREFLKSLQAIEITSDNESDDCDLTWSQIEDLLLAYASALCSEKIRQAIELARRNHIPWRKDLEYTPDEIMQKLSEPQK